ncbi:MAG: regulatory protein RecX [Novosphingobium sp.]
MTGAVIAGEFLAFPFLRDCGTNRAMQENDNHVSERNGRPRKARKPLDSKGFEEIALAYVARFSTTSTKLESYLARKLRERGWDADSGPMPDPAVISARFVALGYVDDAAYARARAGGLLRRGYGPRRISQALSAAGVDAADRADVAPDAVAERQAALILARKRRFGPFGPGEPDRKLREKQIAAMLRAGHRLENACALVDAQTVDDAVEWAGQCYD